MVLLVYPLNIIRLHTFTIFALNNNKDTKKKILFVKFNDMSNQQRITDI